MRTSRVFPVLRLTKPGQISSDVFDKSESCILIPRRLDRHHETPHFCDVPRVLDYLTDTTSTRCFRRRSRTYVTSQAGLPSQNLFLRPRSPTTYFPPKKLHLLRPPRVLSEAATGTAAIYSPPPELRPRAFRQPAFELW